MMSLSRTFVFCSMFSVYMSCAAGGLYEYYQNPTRQRSAQPEEGDESGYILYLKPVLVKKSALPTEMFLALQGKQLVLYPARSRYPVPYPLHFSNQELQQGQLPLAKEFEKSNEHVKVNNEENDDTYSENDSFQSEDDGRNVPSHFDNLSLKTNTSEDRQSESFDSDVSRDKDVDSEQRRRISTDSQSRQEYTGLKTRRRTSGAGRAEQLGESDKV